MNRGKARRWCCEVWLQDGTVSSRSRLFCGTSRGFSTFEESELRGAAWSGSSAVDNAGWPKPAGLGVQVLEHPLYY